MQIGRQRMSLVLIDQHFRFMDNQPVKGHNSGKARSWIEVIQILQPNNEGMKHIGEVYTRTERWVRAG